MTAEIAVMNKDAVAIAADSTVSVSVEAGNKRFSSANKIFTLSKYQPVGIMIYGNASFMGIPWETIIKMYRGNLGYTSFDAIDQYADEFLHFVGNSGLIPEKEQDRYAMRLIYQYFDFIRRDIKDTVDQIVRKDGKISDSKVQEVFKEIIEIHHRGWKGANDIDYLDYSDKDELKERYIGFIREQKRDIFGKLPLTSRLSRLLTEIALNLFLKSREDIAHTELSGIVIAGFGDSDVFPKLRGYHVEGMVNNRLKCRNFKATDIGFDNSATVTPFAQKEMVFRFMEGVDPYYQARLEADLRELLAEYPEVMIEQVPGLSQDEREEFTEKIRSVNQKILNKYIERLEQHRSDEYVQPIVEVVAMLPKDELADMAETLVNLTSFKRKVSLEEETVGGPIDVAVISKGDGFIWIRRKHYFNGDLNPQFFKAYYDRE